VETDTGLPVRTVQEIAALWRSNMNPKADYRSPYSTLPSVSLPYTAGSLKSDYIQDGVNSMNFYRYISGLPGDVTATADLNQKAQYGSVLLASEGQFGHTPHQPADMPEDFYKQGYASTSSANIFMSYGYNNHILFSSIESYMEDSDLDNLSVLGHRRWILNPPLQKTGMGQSKDSNDSSYTVLQVFDKSRPDPVKFHYVPYPARGAFPVEVFKPTTAWSVSLNKLEYALPSLSAVKVTLTRQRDSRTWQFDHGINPVTNAGAYFNVETNNYGSGPAIIFRPDGVGDYRPGDRYQVVIEGLKAKDGTDETIRYMVNFMSAKNPDIPKFSDTARHWSKATVNWAFDKGIASGYPNGTFKPDNTVTEAEFIKMFTVGMGAVIEPFGAWSDAYYAFASTHGFALRGLADASVKSQPINRKAVAELFASAAGRKLSGDDAIRYMLDNGYSKGKSTPTVEGYKGSDTLTRAEAVQFIKNALDANYAIPLVNVTLPL
jgi:uncharacterized protein YkwD